MEFIGRKVELAALEKRWRTADSDMVVLYGRRRVGKSELLRHFIRGKRALFVVGSRSAAKHQIQHFVTEFGVISGDESLGRLSFENWDIVFDRLNRFLEGCTGKTVVVFDELQWFAEASPELPSLLQKWWDSSWSRTGKVFLVLCGSYLGFMEREVLGQKSPLHGRRTSVIHLQPLGFSESRLFNPQASVKEQLKIFLVCGGIPAYHKMFSCSEPFGSQIVSLFFDVDAPLALEANFLLMEELRDPKLYFSMLECLGQGRKTVTELAQAMGVDRSKLPYYTGALTDLHYIQREAPLLIFGEHRERKSAYRIKDPLLRFWFAFVYPNANALSRIVPKQFYLTRVAPKLDAFFGIAFEPVAAELFLRAKVLPQVTESWNIGSYWDKFIQIDFTIALATGFSYLGEVKWATPDLKTVHTFLERTKELMTGRAHRPVLVSLEKVPGGIRKLKEIDAFGIEELL